MANAQAYYDTATITAVKSFKVLATAPFWGSTQRESTPQMLSYYESV